MHVLWVLTCYPWASAGGRSGLSPNFLPPRFALALFRYRYRYTCTPIHDTVHVVYSRYFWMYAISTCTDPPDTVPTRVGPRVRTRVPVPWDTVDSPPPTTFICRCRYHPTFWPRPVNCLRALLVQVCQISEAEWPWYPPHSLARPSPSPSPPQALPPPATHGVGECRASSSVLDGTTEQRGTGGLKTKAKK